MKLFFSPGACSLSPHIALREAGLDFELKRVDLRAHTVEDGTDYYQINPKGYVPALGLDNGAVLAEGPAIVQYIADQAPQSGLAPANGTFERYQLQEWLTFINSEIHKNFSALFNPKTPAEQRTMVLANLNNRLAWVNFKLEGKSFLMGETFTVADGYLFVVVGWSGYLKVDISHLQNLSAFQGRVASRPTVQAAMKAEGLLN